MARPDPGAFADETVLVTGGAGFVGSHIAAALAPHAEVRVLDDLSTGRRDHVPEGVEFMAGDVRNERTLSAATAGVDVVFHQAALASVPQSVEAPLEAFGTNASATVSVLERAREVDARVVLASSAAVYGPPEELPVDEAHPKSPVSPYGASKLTADRFVRLYASLYDLPAVALRYFNVYGPRARNGVVARFLERARAGDPIPVHGDGEQTRDFVHVDDVVRANLAAARTDHVGEAFNVGTGTSTSIRSLADQVREAVDSRSPVVHRDPRSGDIEHSTADVSAARERLGFEASLGIAEGLSTLAER